MSKTKKLISVQSVTIPNGTATHTGIEITGYTLAGVEFPAALTGTGVTVQVSQDNSTFVDVYQGAGVVTFTKQNSKLVLNASGNLLLGVGKYLRVASSGNEGADRILKLYLAPL